MMSSPTDLCNRALAEIGTRSTITSLSEPSPEAANCALQYDPMRKSLLRAAGWGFARAQASLTQLGTALNNTSPFPYLYEYSFPSDCLKVKYIIQVPPGWPFPTGQGTNFVATGDPIVAPIFAPTRRNRFIISTDILQGVRQKVILTNVYQAIGVYTADIVDSDQFDPLFEEALVALVAAKIVIPLTGNAGMKKDFIQSATMKVYEARAADGNEARPTTDHTPDWIKVRGLPYDSYYSGVPWNWGSWFSSFDEMNWGE